MCVLVSGKVLQLCMHSSRGNKGQRVAYTRAYPHNLTLLQRSSDVGGLHELRIVDPELDGPLDNDYTWHAHR